ncbi:MAG: hypothetical protein KC416_06610, partial [Myxococcales bacterium]|nr:hypothetical protein [Myxococcales bacterium]
MTKDGTPVVVLRSNDVCFLGILRSLAHAGATTIPVVFTWPGAKPWYSEASRHFRDSVEIPNPYADGEGAAAALEALGRRLFEKHGQRPMVIPSSDTNLMFLLENFERFAPYFRFIGGKTFHEDRGDVVRKHTCADLLAAADVSQPKTLACLTSADIERVAEEMIYPCVYKPLEKDYG